MYTNEHGSDFKTDQDAMIPIICALINKNDFNKEDWGNPVNEDWSDPDCWPTIVSNARGVYNAYIENFKDQ